MAKIEKSAMHDFVDGSTVTEVNLDQNFELLRVANNDNYDKALAAETKANELNDTVDEMKEIVDNRPIRLREVFTATEGQTLFNLTKGSYEMGQDLLDVTVGTSPQFTNGKGITETSPTSFTLDNAVSAGTLVVATYYMSRKPLTTGHKDQHKKGGFDELTISELNGYDELLTTVDGKITPVSTKLNELEDVFIKETANNKLLQEVNQRVPGSDAIGSMGIDSTALGISIKRRYARAVNALSIGATVFVVDSVSDLSINEEYTIYDDVNLERIKFTAIDAPSKTVTLSTGLTRSFNVNAQIVKSSSVEADFNGFHLGFWRNKDVSTTYNNKTIETTTAPYNYYGAPIKNAGVVMDNGDIIILHSDYSPNNNPSTYGAVVYRVSSSSLELVSNIPVSGESGLANSGLLNLGGHFLGVYYWVYGRMNMRIINLQTKTYVDNSIDYTFTTSEAVATTACVSKDKKTIHMFINNNSGSYCRIRIKPDMTISTEIQFNPLSVTSLTQVVVMTQGSYVCIAGIYSSYYIKMWYRLSDANIASSWSMLDVHYSYNGSSTYQIPSFNAMVDSNGRMWMVFPAYYSGGGTTIRYYCKHAATVNNWSPDIYLPTIAVGRLELAECGDNIVIYNSGTGTGVSIDSIPIHKTSFTVGTNSSTGLISYAHSNAVTGYQHWRIVQDCGNMKSAHVPIMTVTGTNNDWTAEIKLPTSVTSITTAEKWYPVLTTDVRFNLSNVKELTLYVYTTSPTITVKGFVDGVAMIRTASGTETVLDFISDTLKTTVEVRLEFTRSSTSDIDYVTKIIGGKSSD